MPVLSPLRTRTLKTPRLRDSPPLVPVPLPDRPRLCRPRGKDHERLTKSFVLERTTATQRVMILALQRVRSIPPRFRAAGRRTSSPPDAFVCTKVDTLCSPFQEREDHDSPRLRGRIFTKTQSGADPALPIEAPPLATVVAGGSAVGPSGRDRRPGTQVVPPAFCTVALPLPTAPPL